MVMPERLPAALTALADIPTSTTATARVVAAPVVAAAGFTDAPMRRGLHCLVRCTA